MRHDRPAARGRGGVRADRLDPEPSRGRHLKRHIPSDDLEGLPHLGRDVVADLRRVGDVVEVAAAGVGHRLEEPLVEVVADTERRRGHAPGAQRGGMRRQLVRVGDADVGEAVGEEQARG